MILLLSRFFSALPLPTALAIGRAIGWFWHTVLPIRRSVARANIARALGDQLSKAEQKQTIRRCFQHLGMYAVESLRLPTLTAELSEQLVRRVNFEHMENALAKGKGVILVGIHIGSFDLFGCSQAVRGIPATGIFKEIKWKPARDFWLAIRHQTGIKTIPPKRSKHLVREALARGDVVGFAFDQHMAPHRSVVCQFFGHPAATMTAPARFALETGAPIIPAFTYRTDQNGHHVFHCEPELVVETPYEDRMENIHHNMQRLNHIAEGWVRAHPEQWLWLHRRWKVAETQ